MSSLRIAVFASASLFCAALAWAQRLPEPVKLNKSVLGAVTPGQADRALRASVTERFAKPVANDEVQRGPAGAVYPKLGPATVVVTTPFGHGSGFIVDQAGWILTNHHVIEHAGVHAGTGAPLAKVYVGRLEDGLMTAQEQAYLAVVYKVSLEKDLALLRLESPPEKLPVVTFAAKAPAPGTDCIAMGHPRAGLLWTIRSGEIASIGTWPDDAIDTALQRLTAAGADRTLLAEVLAKAPKRKVIVSTCGINPGDSGGPLVDERGQLVGVTFAIPKADPNEGISVDKFSYHIHLDDVRAFLANRPKTPELHVPDPWPVAVLSQLDDLDKDSKPDTWMFGLAPGQSFTGFLMDVDQDTPDDFDIHDAGKRELWDFEFGFQQVPALRTFYDTDNDGQVDLVLTDTSGDGIADWGLEKKASGWTRSAPVKQPLLDPALFKQKSMAERFAKLFPPATKEK